MKTTLATLLRSTTPPAPPAGLADRIMKAMLEEEKKRAQQLRLFSLVGLSVSVILFLVGIGIWGQTLVQSEFWQVATLIISDFGVVLRFWDSLLLALLETFPALSFTLFLIPIFSFFLFLVMYTSVQSSTKFRSAVIYS